jgi:hypothetical protein
MAAIDALHSIDRMNPLPVQMYAYMLEKHADQHDTVYARLAKLGPDAKAATPYLLRALRNESPDVYDEALAALHEVDPDKAAWLWDQPGTVGMPPLPWARLSSEQMNALWTDLANPDAVKAHRALWMLVLAGDRAVASLEERVKPVAVVPQEKLNRQIAELDSDRFDIRQAAGAELEKCVQAAEPTLRRALAERPSLEARRRIDGLLANLDAARSPGRLREVRAVEALERMDSASSRGLLERIAKGAPAARLTRDAKAALERLAKCDAAVP